jgi:hypothetical protein
MGDVDDVEQAEGERDAEADGGIEAPEQHAGDHGIGEQIPGEHVVRLSTQREGARPDGGARPSPDAEPRRYFCAAE